MPHRSPSDPDPRPSLGAHPEQAATEVHAARLVVYDAARLKEAGAPVVQEAAMAKLLASQAG